MGDSHKGTNETERERETETQREKRLRDGEEKPRDWKKYNARHATHNMPNLQTPS